MSEGISTEKKQSQAGKFKEFNLEDCQEIFNAIEAFVEKDNQEDLTAYLIREIPDFVVANLVNLALSESFRINFPQNNQEQILTELMRYAANHVSQQEICRMLRDIEQFYQERSSSGKSDGLTFESFKEIFLSFSNSGDRARVEKALQQYGSLEEDNISDNQETADVEHDDYSCSDKVKDVKSRSHISVASEYSDDKAKESIEREINRLKFLSLSSPETINDEKFIKELPSEADAKKLINSIKLAIHNREWTHKDEKKQQPKSIAVILELIERSESGEINFQETLKMIMVLSKRITDDRKTDRSFPCEELWFHWRHLEVGHMNFYYHRKSPDTHPLLHIAKAACVMAQRLVYEGGNTNENNLKKPSKKFDEIEATVKKNRSLAYKQLEVVTQGELFTKAQILGIFMSLRATLAEKTHRGNCTEQSFVGLRCISKLRDKHRDIFGGVAAEIFSSEKKDHVFIILGRLPNSDPRDISTWGPNAVWCDPFWGKSALVSDLPDLWKSYMTPYQINMEDHMNLNSLDYGDDFLCDKEELVSSVRLPMDSKNTESSINLPVTFHYHRENSPKDKKKNINPVLEQAPVSSLTQHSLSS
ncbi:MAG TPA: hypothetical protein VHE99_06220 [Gammaproteobacteria bacterium]|nr:hypothetical protein [Gammaproteobacteria bacterium]